jgi:membrane-bound lytic murein transglycosylase D
MNCMRHLCLSLCLLSGTAMAASAPPSRNGRALMLEFEQGLAEPGCANASARWRVHYARSATRLTDQDAVALALFAYVLDEVRNAGLPSELALIPFVETRFHPDVRSPGGPAGLWQFTMATAHRNGIRVQAGSDGRISVVESSRAAVRYLSRLDRMFGHQWRQTAMAYNAGDGALKGSRRLGARQLSGITRSYPGKLHAIACLFIEQGGRDSWNRSMERPLPRLVTRNLPLHTHSLRAWARTQGLDPKLVVALNPGWESGSHAVLVPLPNHATAGPQGHRKAN